MGFHHAYNFVPLPKRPESGPLADSAPAGHDTVQDGRLSGRITVTITVITDLLVAEPDTTGVLRLRSASGKPGGPVDGGDVEIPQTSVKGMLRTAYEALTASRFGVIDLPPGDRLPYRQTSQPTKLTRVQLNTNSDGILSATAVHAVNGALIPTGTDYDVSDPVRDGYLAVLDNYLTVLVADLRRLRRSNRSRAEGAARIDQLNAPARIRAAVWLDDNDGPVETLADSDLGALDGLHRRLAAAARTGEHPPGPVRGVAWAVIDDGEVTRLQPVRTSRALSDVGPAGLVPDDYRPPRAWDEFSPADRMFGAVTDTPGVSYRGQAQISAIRTVEATLIDRSGSHLPVQGNPRPSQARFYGSPSPYGGIPYGVDPDGVGWDRWDLYRDRDGIRGRKVYPRHRTWHPPYQANPSSPLAAKISHVVAPGSKFSFDIDIVNATLAEVGALLWLLDPDRLPSPDCPAEVIPTLALGKGKAFGLGAVSLRVSTLDLEVGTAWRARYRTLMSCAGHSPSKPEEKQEAIRELLVAHFEKDAEAAFGVAIDRLAHVQAIRRAASGYDDDLPVRYPHVETNAAVGGVVTWFVSNERGAKRSLPPLWSADGETPDPLK